MTSFRAEHVADLLAEDRGELSDLEKDVVEAIRDQELLTANADREYSQSVSFGQRVADQVASFGGSWNFIGLFAAFMLVWVLANSHWLFSAPFDPFPYILLNLMLSCLAAIQAPVIMMSQNRQESRDRVRDDNDYRINLKAELEIRILNEKVDRLINHQWQRLLEIQQVQTELMEELMRGRVKTAVEAK